MIEILFWIGALTSSGVGVILTGYSSSELWLLNQSIISIAFFRRNNHYGIQYSMISFKQTFIIWMIFKPKINQFFEYIQTSLPRSIPEERMNRKWPIWYNTSVRITFLGAHVIYPIFHLGLRVDLPALIKLLYFELWW